MVKRGRMPVFKKRLVELQGEKSVKDFADEIGITRQAMGYYLNGDRIPDIQMLHQICSACNVSSDWLLGLSDVRSTDIELKQVCEYTGLTEESINKLSSYKGSSIIYIINNFLKTTNEKLNYINYILSTCVELYCIKAKHSNDKKDERGHFTLENGRLSIPLSTSASYIEVLTLRAASKITEDALFATIDELTDKAREDDTVYKLEDEEE